MGVISATSLLEAAERIEREAPWDEARVRRQIEAAFDWADRESPPGCWAWCSYHRPDLRVELDVAFDAIDAAFRARDGVAVSRAINRFGAVIRTAISAYRAENDRESDTPARMGAEA